MRRIDEVRAEVHAALEEVARREFGANPACRSVTLLLAKYWADGADDEIHVEAVASTRDVVFFPHDEPGGAWILLASETWLELELAIADEDMTAAFGAYCHGNGSQEANDSNNYLPYAVVRRDAPLEIVGRLFEPYEEIRADHDRSAGDVEGPDPTWDDPRAIELFEGVLADPSDDDRRRVLGDYMLERGSPYGELISLAFSTEPEARARHDALLATHKYAWLDPIRRIVPMVDAHFERGFLTRAVVCRDGTDDVGHSTLWGTVEHVRIADDRYDAIFPTMTALRSIGPLRERGMEALVTNGRPWTIETLDVWGDPDIIPRLAATTLLPKLHTLVLRYPDLTLVRALARSTWWSQLRELVVLDATPLRWRGVRSELGLARLAVRAGDAWEVAFTDRDDAVELSRCGWTGQATLDFASRMLQLVAPAHVRLVRSRYWDPNTEVRDAIAALNRAAAITLE